MYIFLPNKLNQSINHLFNYTVLSQRIDGPCNDVRRSTRPNSLRDESRSWFQFTKIQCSPDIPCYPRVTKLKAASDGQYKLALANGVFLIEGLSVRLSFQRLIGKYYSAGFEELDFAGDPQGTADYINQWVEDRTNGKIKDIVSPDLIEQSMMAPANTIYFKGFWKCPVQHSRYKTRTFQSVPRSGSVCEHGDPDRPTEVLDEPSFGL